MATDLETRIARLEAQNRRLRVAGSILVLVLAAAIVWIGLPENNDPDAPLRASAFWVVDELGVARAMLDATDEGAPALSFFDADGRPRMMVSLADSGSPSLVFADELGRPRSEWSELGDGSTSLGLRDETGTLRGAFAIGSGGKAGIYLFDEGGRVEWSSEKDQTP